jgi:AAA+ ATPase superfamily predicted ATPase
VDDFDYNTTVDFLKKYGFSKEEIELTWNYFGGKPVYLVKAIKNKHRLREFCKSQLKLRFSQILDAIYDIEKTNLFNEVIELFRAISESEVVKYEKIDEGLKFCVRKNILFVEPVERIVKPQSRLDLLAIKKVLQKL